MPKRELAGHSAAHLVADIRAYCQKHAQPDKADKWARYFSEGYDSWGLLDKGHPIFTTQQEAWTAKYAGLGLDGFIEAGCELFKSGKYEEGALAIRFVKQLRDGIGPAQLQAMEGWFDGGVRNWAHVDVMCMEILSPLLETGKLKPDNLSTWRSSPHRFQRRAAVVSMLALLKAKGGPKKALAFIEPMMEETKRWFIRAWGGSSRKSGKLSPAWRRNSSRSGRTGRRGLSSLPPARR